ncbi:odorant receptor 131-2-like [Fundulus diaphanus]
MSYVSQSNVSAELQYQDFLERVITFTLVTIPSCVFLFINGTMMFTLRSKSVFCDTCRYILLYNLLFADTVQLMISQVLFLLAVCRIRLTYPVCGTITRVATLSTVISPLTLLVMSLERFVAVCYPLRHAAIITINNTRMAVTALWAFSALHNLIGVVLLLGFPFEKQETLQMTDFCSDLAMLLGPRSKDYNRGFTIFLFVSAGVVILSSYFGVVKAARSASTDKCSALKARNTLLLHMVQLCLSLSSTIFNPLLLLIIKVVTRDVFARLHKFLYVLIILFPTCLSSLIYGLRDQSIRPVLLHNLSCRIKVKVVAAKG